MSNCKGAGKVQPLMLAGHPRCSSSSQVLSDQTYAYRSEIGSTMLRFHVHEPGILSLLLEAGCSGRATSTCSSATSPTVKAAVAARFCFALISSPTPLLESGSLTPPCINTQTSHSAFSGDQEEGAAWTSMVTKVMSQNRKFLPMARC